MPILVAVGRLQMYHPVANELRLEDEVSGLPHNYSDSDLEGLPYLSAFIDGTLRLNGAAPGSLPGTASQKRI